MTRSAAAVLCLALVAASCGGDGTAERDPLATAQAFSAAVNDGDWTAACELSMRFASCESLLASAFDGASEDMSVAGVYASGASARVAFRGAPAGFSATVERRDEAWRVHPELQRIR